MSEALPISVLLLARDETRELSRLIPVLSFARETVVVWDPRGDRATRETAERLGARVIERAFEGFGAQRQFALALCRERWVLWIDADERPAPGFEAGLRQWLPSAGEAAGARVLRHTWFLGRRIRFCGWRGERVLRLFRRERARFDDAPVHERLLLDGAIEDLPLSLEHHSYSTMDDCLLKMDRYARAGAEKAWNAGRRAHAIDVALRPPLRFFRQYVLQAGLLDGAHGLLLCSLAAAQVMIKYGLLWDRTRRERGAAAEAP
ncbi:MAG: glycosyltransferase family 2 protein [Candidatus Eiseniibacteriota bacterium]